MTIGQLAVKGQEIYDTYCRCHGSNLIGSYGYIYLSSFGNARNLLDYNGAAMPKGGGISQQEQWEVLCYLLVQNNFTSPDTVFNLDTLSQIQLKRPS
jgi:hypothetical protein